MDWWDRRSRAEVRAIWTFVIIIAVIFAIAAYGYFTGSWDRPVID